MQKIFPVLLAGGYGRRLWPLSRKSYPKQFSRIIGEKTLFQRTAERLTSSETLEFAPHITLTNADFRFVVGEQLQQIGLDPGPILIEPETKNTAAAILAASLFTMHNHKDAILLVAPSDHVIPDKNEFHSTISFGLPHLKNGKFVALGITPNRPETGYGYLKLSKDTIDDAGTAVVSSFVEKPELASAAQMLAEGNYLWNAGIFLFRAKDMIEAFETNMPEMLEVVSESIAGAKQDIGFLRLDADAWWMLEDISVDYAIMEKVQNLVAVPFKSQWSDLGGWDAVWSESISDQAGNVLSDTAHVIDCSNSLLRSESSNQQVVGIGLDNIIAIAMPDAVLVSQKDRAQDVKKAVELLKSKNITQAEIFPKDHRPWGWFEILSSGERFQVKRICVKPGASLSLQSHNQRSEHWIVVEGTASVLIDQEDKLVREGESVYVPLGAKHRLANHTEELMILVEVQIGNYLGEDDIVRYEDLYART